VSVNRVLLVGHLGRDAEMKFTANGTAVSKFSLATTERRKKGDQWEDATEWHRVTLFGKSADALQPYLVKGKQVCVEGRIETRSWDDKDGQKRFSTEIVAERVTLIGGGPSRAADRPTPAPVERDNADDGIPF
jgi:single-strand DNA-binding protein